MLRKANQIINVYVNKHKIVDNGWKILNNRYCSPAFVTAEESFTNAKLACQTHPRCSGFYSSGCSNTYKRCYEGATIVNSSCGTDLYLKTGKFINDVQNILIFNYTFDIFGNVNIYVSVSNTDDVPSTTTQNTTTSGTCVANQLHKGHGIFRNIDPLEYSVISIILHFVRFKFFLFIQQKTMIIIIPSILMMITCITRKKI